MQLTHLPAELVAVPPWSKNKLRQLGECLRDGVTPKPGLPEYDDVLLWYDGIATATQGVIRSLNWSEILPKAGDPDVTSRAKTRDTLTDKLKRQHGLTLGNVQDVAGVRFEAEMGLGEQDVVAERLAETFGCSGAGVHDLRATPSSGYRAVHIWARFPAGNVEIQVRTHLQGQWANAYEAFADIAGRGIRYGEMPDDPALARMTRDLHDISLLRGIEIELLRQDIFDLSESIASTLEELDGEATKWPGPREPRRIALARKSMNEVRASNEESIHRLARLEDKYTRALGELEALCRRAKAKGEWPWLAS